MISAVILRHSKCEHIPLLDLVPSWQRWNRDEDDDSLATMSNLNL